MNNEVTDRAPLRAVLSRCCLGLFAVVAAAYLLQLGCMLLLGERLEPLLENTWFTWLFSLFPMYGIGLPIAYALLRRVPTCRPEEERVRFWPFVGVFLIAYALMYVANLFSTLFNMLFELIFQRSSASDAITMIEEGSIWQILLFAVLLGPLMEELLFRRWILSRLLPYGRFTAILVSSVLFGLYHGNLMQLLYATVLGLAFGTAYCKFGRFFVPVLLHMLINFFGSVVPLLVFRIPTVARLLETAENSDISLTLNEMLAGLLPLLLYMALIGGLVITGAVLFFLYRRPCLAAIGRPGITRRAFLIALPSVGVVLFLLMTTVQVAFSFL